MTQGACGACGRVQEARRFCIFCGHDQLAPAKTAVASGVPLPAAADRLPRGVTNEPGRLHVLGAHRGAGAATLAAAVPGLVNANGQWPYLSPDGIAARSTVVLACRTHVPGLRAAQNALREWASGSVSPVEVVGLVFVADIPGRLPKEIRDLQRMVAGGAPASMSVPYLTELRLGQDPASLNAFKQLNAVLARYLPTS